MTTAGLSEAFGLCITAIFFWAIPFGLLVGANALEISAMVAGLVLGVTCLWYARPSQHDKNKRKDEVQTCDQCQAEAPTKPLAFRSTIGVVYFSIHNASEGRFCKKCAKTFFWTHTLSTFGLGWWSLHAFFLNPVIVIFNIVNLIDSRMAQPQAQLGNKPPFMRVSLPKVAVFALLAGVFVLVQRTYSCRLEPLPDLDANGWRSGRYTISYGWPVTAYEVRIHCVQHPNMDWYDDDARKLMNSDGATVVDTGNYHYTRDRTAIAADALTCLLLMVVGAMLAQLFVQRIENNVSKARQAAKVRRATKR